jgi:hypothetical protein
MFTPGLGSLQSCDRGSSSTLEITGWDVLNYETRDERRQCMKRIVTFIIQLGILLLEFFLFEISYKFQRIWSLRGTLNILLPQMNIDAVSRSLCRSKN